MIYASKYNCIYIKVWIIRCKIFCQHNYRVDPNVYNELRPGRAYTLAGKDVIVKKGRYGYYLSHDTQNYKFKEGMNEYLTLEDALKCIEGTAKTTVLKQFSKTAVIKNGQYGPYILYNKKFTSVDKYLKSINEPYTLIGELIN